MDGWNWPAWPKNPERLESEAKRQRIKVSWHLRKNKADVWKPPQHSCLGFLGRSGGRTTRRSRRAAGKQVRGLTVSCTLWASLPPPQRYRQGGSYRSTQSKLSLLQYHSSLEFLCGIVLNALFSPSEVGVLSGVSCDRPHVFFSGWGISGCSCSATLRTFFQSCLVRLIFFFLPLYIGKTIRVIYKKNL